MAPILPEHLQRGRTAYPGPTTGGYVSLTFGNLQLAVASAASDVMRAGLVLPFAMRLVCVTWNTTSAAANSSFQVYTHASAFQIAGATALLSAAVDIDGDISGRALPSGSTPTLVAAARDLTRGSRVFVAMTSDAGGTYIDFSVTLQGYSTGVVNLDPAND